MRSTATNLVRPTPFMQVPVSLANKAAVNNTLAFRKLDKRVIDYSFEFNGLGVYSLCMTFPTIADRVAVWEELKPLLKD